MRLSAALLLLLLRIPLPAQPIVTHVILITLDAMRPEFYQDPSFPTPNLQHMMQEGAYAKHLRPVNPTVTYPNHISMITGALPARHGVYYNAPFTPLSTAFSWNFYARIIKIPTLFDKIHAENKITAALDWPASVGMKSVDFNFPNYWGIDTTTDNATLMREVIYPPGLWEELETNALGKVVGEEINSDSLLRTDENMGRIAGYLIMRYKPTFMAMHIVEADAAQHHYGTKGYKVMAAISSADHTVGDVLEAVERAGLQDSTAILVAGDHGFADIHAVISPNVWLARAGVFHPITATNPTHWRARFHSATGMAFLYLEDKKDTAAIGQARRALDNLPAKYRRLFRLLERPQLDQMGIDSAVALGFAPEVGIQVSGAWDVDPLRATHGGTHGFMNDTQEMMTGFIAYGAGIRKGTVLTEMSMPDIAPLIARLLGISFDCPDGVLWPGLLLIKK
jgi:predicted AlkP superfamily pyrophosphatase or phosphodiesterase